MEEEPEEEEVAPLGSAASDPPISELLPEEALPAWSMKTYFGHGRDAAVSVAKSHRWPGAYSVAVMKADKFANLYVGYGCESSGSSFTPEAPPQILTEAPDAEEQEDVSLAAENELLKAIEESKMVKEEEGEEDGED